MHPVRSLLVLTIVYAAMITALPGCAQPATPQVLVIVLRDDAAHTDIRTLESLLTEDDRVVRCVYSTTSESPSEEQAAIVGTPTLGPDGDMPWTESRLEATLRPGLSEAEFRSLLELVESRPSFWRAVLRPDSEQWWYVRLPPDG